MDNTLNRPLFRRREARDRLNEMAGIKGYQDGGPIRSGMEMEARRVVPSGIVSAIPRSAPGTQVIETENYGSFLFDPSTRQLTDRQGNRVPSEFARVILQDAAAAASRVGIAATAAGEQALQNVEQGFKALPTVRPDMSGEVLQDLKGDLAAANTLSSSGREQMDIFEELTRAAEKPAPEPVISRGPAGARPEGAAYGLPAARNAPQATSAPGAANLVRPVPEPPTGLPEAPGAEGMETAAKGPSGMEMEARGRGPLITNPAAVASGLNDPEPAVREKTAADFMQEFMANAPKYEGGDKKLMHAMIGFAIAAGESPNAMTNIANGLLAGSEMMLKDKAEKDAFDRQVRLNALQYGMGEIAKDRELERNVTDYVAGQDITYRGRKYSRGSNVPVLNSDIVNGRLPDGLVDTALAASLAEKNAAMQQVAIDAYEQKLVDDTTLGKDTETYAGLVDEAVRIQRANDLFEKALFVVGKDGTVTGAQGALKNFVYKAANAAGLDPANLDDMLSDPAELEKLLVAGATAALPSYLGNEAGNAISNEDVARNMRVIIRGVTAQGSFDSLFKNDRAVLADIQQAIRINMGQMDRIFGQMSSIENRYANRYTRSGSIVEPVSALSAFEPIRRSAGVTSSPIPTVGDIVVGEDGVWNLYTPEG